MTKAVLKVEGMSCEHCVKAVSGAVSALPGVTDVAVDLAAQTVTIGHDPEQADVGGIKAAIEDQGYDVVG